MGRYPDDVRKRRRSVHLIALAAASLVIGTSIRWASAQTPTPISIPFTNYCDTVTIGPDTIMSNPTGGSGTLTLTPGVPNDTSGVSFVNVQSQIVSIWAPRQDWGGSFRGTLTCHLVIGEHPVDIARSVSIDIGGCCAHEGHGYTFAPFSVAFPLLGGTLHIKDPGHAYDVIFGVPRPQGFHATFPAEPATLLLAIEPSSAMPIPTLMPVGLCALGVLVAVLGISAMRQGRRA